MIDATFREIHDDDMQSIFDVRVATWHNENGRQELTTMGITPDSVRNLLQRTHRGWLCELDTRVVGFTIGNRETGEVWVIAVLRDYENRGIGRELLRLVESWLFDQGWATIWLTTDRDECVRAVGFYRHLGWSDWKVEPHGDRFMRKSDPSLR